MVNVVTDFELKRLKEIKLTAINKRYEICKDRDGNGNHPYFLSKLDIERPLTDFMPTEIVYEYLKIKDKLKSR